MTELTPGAIHKEDFIDRGIIHSEDVDQVAEVSRALHQHIIENQNQFAASTAHGVNVDIKLDAIKSTIDSWAPYITEGMKKSEAYKYVSADLKAKGNGIKWWVGFVIVFFSLMGGIYSVVEMFHVTR